MQFNDSICLEFILNIYPARKNKQKYVKWLIWPFDQCAQCQNKAVRAAALTIFSKMGAKDREHPECIL